MNEDAEQVSGGNGGQRRYFASLWTLFPRRATLQTFGNKINYPMPACELKPADKRKFLSDVGQELVEHHGKRRYYRTDDIGRAATARGYPIDWVCWAYCIFSSPEDFRSLHESLGEACDYTKMKAEALTDLAGGEFQWPDIDLSWLEWPDIDLSRVFDWFDWSP